MNALALDPPEHGVHGWLLTAGWRCRAHGLNPEQAVREISATGGRLRAGRRFQPGEVEEAVAKAYGATVERREREPKPQPPTWNPRETARLTEKHGTTPADLWHASPVIPDDGLEQRFILSTLFPDPEGLLCIGRNTREFRTATLAEHGELRHCEHVTPAYMTAREGLTKDNPPRLSEHAESNTGPRRFIVCDFDKPPREEQPSIIYQLSTFPVHKLALVVFSGNRSFHAWFPVSPSANENRVFWRLAIMLGADPFLEKNRSSFVRLPLGTRGSNGREQSVLYFNPEAIPQ